MVNYSDAHLDLIFAALSDATRRRILKQLGAGSCSVTELATPSGMSLPGFMKHLAVLETAGLIERSKAGRVVSCALAPAPMQDAAAWLAFYQPFWETQLDALGRFLYHQEELASCTPHTSTATPSASGATTPPASTKSGAPGRTRKR